MISEETKEKWRKKLTAIAVARCSGSLSLSEWESEFIDSINTAINTDKELSFKQSSVLSKIYGKIE